MIKTIALLSPVYATLFWGVTLLIQRRPANQSRFVLGIFMLFACMLYVSHTVFFLEFYHTYSFFESIYLYAGLSVYPLFYTYILLLSTIRFNTRRHLLHFLPGILFGVVALILTSLLTPDQRIYYVKHILINENLKNIDTTTLTGVKALVFLISRIIFILQTVIYLIFGIRIANQHNKTINNFFSETEGKRMNWVRDISILVLGVSLAAISFALLGRSYFVQHDLLLLLPSAFFTVFFFILGYKGNLQQPIYERLYENDEALSYQEDAPPEENNLKERLLVLFEENKIYRLNDLRIHTISESLHTNRTYISRLINEEFQMNFNEFVNQYRIKEAKELLRTPASTKYTMEYIAEQAGFGSVASFSRVFKEIEGVTPGKYRLMHNKD
ncbi:helix-turn-helix transcriptional regulator [uncultured Draconibacterium sp.]|uniref:helix-turn-helix domain-containing protein n=1 Tax=uncultured Draconibacterium sp. TaxID=1573823 RepID=UPI0025F8E700|nr:helix-turn-helix transcriptional regulator [uncultured Draconibacterium sp.]